MNAVAFAAVQYNTHCGSVIKTLTLGVGSQGVAGSNSIQEKSCIIIYGPSSLAQ